ncbi:MAG: protein phosphatase 2C domain-containing protein, partial [candidate division Zixibacteria bacterium]|nr:protein phosphatase 2C domain-containing protein [candidate division Zixibacteria bacterium]
QAGEVASRDACNIIGYCFSSLAGELAGDAALAIPAAFPAQGDLLVKAIRLANRNIYIHSRSHSNFSGMGTTVVGAVLEKNIINIAHVGDSRVYRLTEAGLVPLTTDHSWVSELMQTGQFSDIEAAQMVGRNVITRALGVNERVEIDYRADRIKAGEIYIFCTDGLSAYAEDEEIFEAAKGCKSDVNLIVDNLIQLANDRGGQDNVTIIAIRIDSFEESPELPIIKPVTISIEGDDALLRENQILDTLTKAWEKTQDIVTEEEGKGKKAPLILIFFLFIVAAVILIYFATHR